MISPKRVRAHRRVDIFDLQPLEIRRFLTTASLSGGMLTITGTSGAETITVNKNTSNRITITGVTSTFDVNAVTQMTINAQGGSDTITITGAVGSNKPSTINAGDGNDVIATGLSDDVIFGQNGFDTVNYSARTARVTVRLDGLQNDGETQNGESDNVNAEEVLGGSGNDLFYGNDSANFFAGGGGADEMAAAGGNDELVGSTGSDKLYGEGGDDALYAKNSDVDTVNGGTGPAATDLDLAEIDSLDVASSVSSSALVASRIAALTAAAATAAAVDAAAPDPAYGGAGTGLNSGPDFDWVQVTAATVDSQGRTILVGYFDGPGFGGDFVAVRYNADGTFDATFAGDGQAEVDFKPGNGSFDDRAFGVTTDAQDNIIIVGKSGDGDDFAVCRLTNTGALDAIFGARLYDIGGSDSAADVVVDDLGNIVVVGTTTPSNGNSDIALIRITPNGALDATFNGTGKSVLAAPGAQVASAVIMDELLQAVDEGILVGGSVNGDFVLARFTLDGAVDTDFGDSPGYSVFTFGASTLDQLKDVMVNPVTGQVVAVGQSNGAGAILSVDADGSSNAQFTTHGLTDQSVSFNAIAYDPWNAGFAVVGSTGTIDRGELVDADFVVAKFDTPQEFADGFTGLLVTDFSPAGSSWSDVALGLGLVRGKIIVGGYSQTDSRSVQTSVARYNVGTGAKDVEDDLAFDDVQNDPGANRSATATFYLKSTHVDDQGRATINLTDNSDLVIIDKVIGGDGEAQARVNVNGLFLHYDMDMTSLTINCFNGSDVVTFSEGTNPNDITLPLFIFGGNGTDQLNGGGGSDVIVGGLGNDTIVGNNGNDILVGGPASDVLNGGNGEDILVGTIAYDDDIEALSLLHAEWTSNTARQDRINHINGTTPGGLNGTVILTVGTGGTISDDSAKDTYTGGNDLDWFFRRNTGGSGSRDVIVDNFLGEEVTDF